jgi:arabinogalactan endo-1,4-beta-galactosidase
MKILNTTRLILVTLILIIQSDVYAQFAKGADVSWVSQMEDSGYKFYNSSGTQQDIFTILKGKGLNTVRLRVWLNPWAGWCGKADVVAKAIRAKNAGFRIMIDFHYSDSWADPGKQTKPASWASYSLAQLTTAVRDHTVDVLNTLKSNGISVEWVQVGNETNDGLLWEDGRASTYMKNYAQLVSSGYDAVKSVYPGAKVVVHLSNGYDNALFRWNFDGLKNNGGKWDVIGMSLYPTKTNWSTLNAQCLANMQDMINRYGKQVMVVEVGMEARLATDCKAFLIDLMNKTASLPNGNGLGVLYWEPQAYGRWQGYTKGAFDDKGKPTVALDAFSSVSARESTNAIAMLEESGDLQLKSYPNPVDDILFIKLPADLKSAHLNVFNDKGQQMMSEIVNEQDHRLNVRDMQSGLYYLKIHNGNRQIVTKFIKK